MSKEEKKFPKRGGKGGKPNPKNPKPNPDGDGIHDELPKVDSWQKKDNDIGWYTKYPQLVEAQSSIIFNKIMGSSYEYADPLLDTSDKPVIQSRATAIPGVVTLLWRPFTCATGSTVDALNVASKNLYTFVRHANSGSVNYESADFMQYVLTVMQLYTFAEQLKRDLRLILTYKASNRYAYKAVLRTYGYSDNQIATIVTNYAAYVGELNVAIAQLNALKVPAEFNVFARHLWMAHNIWKDDSLDKATYFSYITDGYYHYDWANATIEYQQAIVGIETGSENAQNAFSSRLARLVNEINNLLAYEDIGIMIGDTLKAYKAEACFAMPLLSLNEVIDAEFSDEMANQFRNATILSTYSTLGTYTGTIKIKQSSSDSQILYEESGSSFYSGTTSPGEYYVWAPEFHVGSNGHMTKYYPPLVVNSDDPTNADVILNTRLTYGIEYAFTTTSGPSSALAKVTSCGTELIITGIAARYDVHNNPNIENVWTNGFEMWPFKTIMTIDGVNAANYSAHVVLSMLDQVSFAPNHFVYLRWTRTIEGNTYNYGAFCPYVKGKNVIRLENDWLKRMHDACKLSEFTIPMFKLLETV